MYCNSCVSPISKNDAVWCSSCGVPLHKECANHCTKCGKVLCDQCSLENHFVCEECAAKDEVKIVRRSYLEMYKGCPYSLGLVLEKGLQPDMGGHAQLGVIIHDTIDKVEKGKLNVGSMSTVIQHAVEDWNKSVEGNEYSTITDAIEDRIKTCVDSYLIMSKLIHGTTSNEENIVFSVEEGLPKVSCTIDKVSKVDPATIHIHDWKTGKPLSGKGLITDLQPACYIFAVYSKYKVAPKTFNLHYLLFGKTITYRLVDEENLIYEVTTARNTYTLKVLDVVFKEVKEILTFIKSKRFPVPAYQKVSWRCQSMCWFKSNGHCAGVDVVGWTTN